MSTRSNNRAGGFTLMEMVVIIFVLTIIAAAIVPRLVSVLQSEELKTQVAALVRLPAEARDDAVRNQNPVRLRFDGTSVIEEEVMLDGTINQLKEVDLGSSIQVDEVQKNYTTGDPSSWDWTAYPDGTSDTGGVQVSIDSEQRSLTIPASGEAVWATGPLPDESQNQWTAGQLLQRTS